jgi:hypothetical protein
MTKTQGENTNGIQNAPKVIFSVNELYFLFKTKLSSVKVHKPKFRSADQNALVISYVV